MARYRWGQRPRTSQPRKSESASVGLDTASPPRAKPQRGGTTLQILSTRVIVLHNPQQAHSRQRFNRPAPGVKLTPPPNRFHPPHPPQPRHGYVLGVMRGFMRRAELLKCSRPTGHRVTQHNDSSPPMIAIRFTDDHRHTRPPRHRQPRQGHVKVGSTRASRRQTPRGRQKRNAVRAAVARARQKPSKGR